MNTNSSDQGPASSDDASKQEFLEQFQKAIASYADAVNRDQTEEADQAAVAAFMMAAAEAMAHPTPDLQLAGKADEFLSAGDWEQAEAAYRELLAMQEQAGNFGLLAKPQMDLSRLFRLIGRLDDAWEFAQAATASARKTELYPLMAMALENQALCALARGDSAAALAAASEAVSVIEPGKMGDLMRARAYTIQAECLLVNRDATGAEQALKAGWEFLGSRKLSRIGAGPVVALAKWFEVKARLFVHEGDLKEAVSALKQALEHRQEGLHRSCDPSPYAVAAVAKDLELLAQIWNKTGDTTAAQQALAEANTHWESVHLPKRGINPTAGQG